MDEDDALVEEALEDCLEALADDLEASSDFDMDEPAVEWEAFELSDIFVPEESVSVSEDDELEDSVASSESTEEAEFGPILFFFARGTACMMPASCLSRLKGVFLVLITALLVLSSDMADEGSESESGRVSITGSSVFDFSSSCGAPWRSSSTGSTEMTLLTTGMGSSSVKEAPLLILGEF